MERRWIGEGCVELWVGRTAMVLVYALLTERPNLQQLLDRLVSMASGLLTPGVSQQGHVISILQVSDEGLQLKYHVVPDKLSIMAVCNTHIFVLCPMAVKRYLDDGIKIKVEECWGKDATLSHSAHYIEPLRHLPVCPDSICRTSMQSLDDRHKLGWQAIRGLKEGPKGLTVDRIVCFSEVNKTNLQGTVVFAALLYLYAEGK